MFEQARVWKSLRNCALGLCVAGFSGLAAETASAGDENLLLRVEANIQDGPVVKISVPVSSLSALMGSVSQAAEQSGQALPIHPEEIIEQIAKAEGEDLVKVSGEEQDVRVWVEKVEGDDSRDLNFLKIYAKPDPEENMEINICLPKGLIEMAGTVAASLPGPMNLGEMMKQMHRGHHPPAMFHPQEEAEHHEMKEEAERHEKPEKPERPEKPEKPERPEMKEKPEGPDMQDLDIDKMVKEIQKEVMKELKKIEKQSADEGDEEDEDSDGDQN